MEKGKKTVKEKDSAGISESCRLTDEELSTSVKENNHDSFSQTTKIPVCICSPPSYPATKMAVFLCVQ